MKRSAAKRVALLGMLFGLAAALSFFESLIAPLFALPPGVKLGLANVVVLYTLLYVSRGAALLIVLLKAGFVLATRGGMAGALSLAGGLLSLGVMLLLLALKCGILLVSVAGSLGHNIGQLGVFSVIMGRFAWVYAPVLLVSGVVMGVLTALCLRVLMPALRRIGLQTECAIHAEEPPPDD